MTYLEVHKNTRKNLIGYIRLSIYAFSRILKREIHEKNTKKNR